MGKQCAWIWETRNTYLHDAQLFRIFVHERLHAGHDVRVPHGRQQLGFLKRRFPFVLGHLGDVHFFLWGGGRDGSGGQGMAREIVESCHFPSRGKKRHAKALTETRQVIDST